MDAKDKLFEKEVSKVEALQKQLDEAHAKNKYHEELLEAKATDIQNLSIFVSKMLKEHFMDYESHTITQPPLQQKLEILDRHLGKVSSKAKHGGPQSRSSSNAIVANTSSQNQLLEQKRQRPGSAIKATKTGVANQHNSSTTQSSFPSQSTPAASSLQGKTSPRHLNTKTSPRTAKPPTTKQPTTKTNVAKQVAQALEIDNLGKMDAVDILSVLKRIENLEKMACSKGKKSSSSNQRAAM